MTDKRMDEQIEAAMGRVEIPWVVHERITKVTGAIRENARRDSQTKKGRRTVHLLRMAFVAAALVACMGIAVFAATKWVLFRTEQLAEHEVALGVRVEGTGEEIDPTKKQPLQEVPAVEMKIGYLPEGLVDVSLEKGSGAYRWENRDGGFFIHDPYVMDVEDGTWEELYVQEHESIQLQDRGALYVCKRVSADEDWLWQDVYLPFPEVDRMILVSAWGTASREDLLEVAQSITLTPTGQMQAVQEQQLFSTFLASKAEEEETLSEGIPYQTAASAEEVSNLHQVGEWFTHEAWVREKGILPVKVRVSEVQIVNNLSPLKEERIPEEWKGLVLEDGCLGKAKRSYIKKGDGRETMNEVIREEEVPLRLVVVTLEYANETKAELEDILYHGALLRLGEEEGTYRILHPTWEDSETCVYDLWIGTGDMQYNDVLSEEQYKNYIPKIGAGETRSVKLAWLVGEDETDQLYLSLCGGAYEFTERMLEEGLIALQ